MKISLLTLWTFTLCLLLGGCIFLKKDANKGSGANIKAPFDLVSNEGVSNPIGFYNSQPNFSWKLPVTKKVKWQSAYRVVVASNPSLLPYRADLWDSKKVISDQSTWLDYPGPALQARQKIYWQVMFWDQSKRASKWSDVAHIEAGLLNNTDWQAQWIHLADAPKNSVSKNGYNIHKPQYFRRSFDLNTSTDKARLYITAKGVFEAEINGKKIGRDVMTPGWTPYKKRIETLTYDVTGNLTIGPNTIGITLTPGWHSGRIAYRRSYKGETPIPQVIAQLEITDKNGKRKVIATDTNWRATQNGPIRFSDIYQGEDYNANLEMPGWSTSMYDEEKWNPVRTKAIDPDVQLQPKRHAPVRDKETLPALTITEPEPGKLIFDFGQNIVGVPELNIPMIKNKKITLRFAEMLQSNGALYTANYRSARSTDSYTPNRSGQTYWKPKFTFHGFRYIELSGFDTQKEPNKNWIKAVVQHSDFNAIGSFTSSHKKLNKLQRNITWGLKGNFFDIPTDCPQRDERMGWTGDAQAFAPTSLLNANVHAFWASWLQSAREEQFVDGGIPNVIPNNRSTGSSAGWADAVTIIPWEIYLRTGDKKILKENYSMMKKLVNYYRLDPTSRFSPLKSFGDWLQPHSSNSVDNRRGDTPTDLTETAFYARTIQITLNAAKVLEIKDDIKELEQWLTTAKNTFEENYLSENGKLTTPIATQTGYLLPLSFNLISPEKSKKLIPHLVSAINQAHNHLRTGFLGTPLLAPVLQKYKQTDLMYQILFKETYPSWFYSINQGATTLWERWNSYSHKDGFGDDNMNSFNHYAYGAIGQWMYEGIAGIQPLEPGYKRILIAPTPGGKLEFAQAKYNSVYGLISSSWRIQKNGLEVKVTIPPNTTARVVIPVQKSQRFLVDGSAASERSGVSSLQRGHNEIALEIIAGSYTFNAQ